ncbi:GNAT family N-acetyltransferase [Candidatus Pacearchaeota archaeon]|nr:GNAT family N-acetyltransferase [Candidatus Pacearchaeota archaeon]
MKPELRQAKEKDVGEIAKIYMEEFSKPPYKEQWTLKKAFEQIRLYSRNYDLYTITLGDKIIGFIAVNSKFMCPADVVFWKEIAIKEEYQNRGIGTFVISEIMNIYKEKGYKKIMGIVKKDFQATNLYRKLGIYQSNDNVLIEKRLR